jgi:hypothetical protein
MHATSQSFTRLAQSSLKSSNPGTSYVQWTQTFGVSIKPTLDPKVSETYGPGPTKYDKDSAFKKAATKATLPAVKCQHMLVDGELTHADGQTCSGHYKRFDSSETAGPGPLKYSHQSLPGISAIQKMPEFSMGGTPKKSPFEPKKETKFRPGPGHYTAYKHNYKQNDSSTRIYG